MHKASNRPFPYVSGSVALGIKTQYSQRENNEHNRNDQYGMGASDEGNG